MANTTTTTTRTNTFNRTTAPARGSTMRTASNIVKLLFEQDKNAVRYMFRLIGIKVVSNNGFYTPDAVEFNLSSGTIRNTLITNRVIKYFKQGDGMPDRIGLTKMGWEMFMSDAMKHGYCVPPQMFNSDMPSSLEDLQEVKSRRALAYRLTEIEIRLQAIATLKTSDALKEKTKLHDEKMALLADLTELEANYQAYLANQEVATTNN